MNGAFLVQGAFAFLRLLRENVAFESALEGDLAGACYLEPLFGTRVGFNLWHFKCFLHDTLLADPHRRNTYGAVWAVNPLMMGSSADGPGVHQKRSAKLVFFWE